MDVLANQSDKYNRTFHYPFSPGTTSDDRINQHYWQDIQAISNIVHTEKLDGENNCLNKYGVFARSHAIPTQSPWTHHLRLRWQTLKNDLGDFEIFLENLFAIHSIHYRNLESHYYVFAVRQNGQFLSWEAVKEIAALFDFPTVPEIKICQPNTMSEAEFKKEVLHLVGQAGSFDPHDTHLKTPSTIEGIVSRNAEAFSSDHFSHNVFKYVRKNHVKTDAHWRQNWQRAPLNFEHSLLK